jgi:hypothetical protein
LTVQALTSADHDFGVVIPAKQDHLHWVKGACASIRHFMGDTPICVILDGVHFPDDMRKLHDIQVVRRDDVEVRELRDLSFGSLKAKNTALWVSPFETFLLLDADAVVWGDMRQHADFDRVDFVLDRPIGDPDSVRRWVMDVDAVDRTFPDFDARGHESDYVNTGAYLGRRGMLELDRYVELLRVSRDHPGMFYGSQGIFNFMVFSAADEGTLRLDQRELQVTTGDTTREEVARRFAFVDSQPSMFGQPVVLHWAGSQKPRVRERGRDYFKPMTHFRGEFRRAARGGVGPTTADGLRLRLEDMMCADWRGSNMRGRLGRLRRRSRQRYARAKVAVRKRTPNWIVGTLRRRARSEWTSANQFESPPERDR